MPTEQMYPPPAPSISGQNITIDLFLRNPSRVQRVMQDLSSQRFIADTLYSSGDAQGGSVVYDRVSEQDLYTQRDIEEISPGSEFPNVGGADSVPLVAKVAKRGGQVQISYEAVRRNNRDMVQRNLTKLRNTIVKKHDAIAVSTLLADADKLTATAALEWNDPLSDPFADFASAVSAIEQQDLGYTADIVLINPQERFTLLTHKDIREALPRENAAQNPVLSGQLAGLCGISNWVVSNRVPAGTVVVANSKIVGSMRDEMPLYTRVIDKPEVETWIVQAARVSVPVITDPKSALVLTGVFNEGS